MKKTVNLAATSRDRLGSRYSARVRSSGGLPAVLYGHGEAPTPITLDGKEARRHINAGGRVFSIAINGKEQIALLKDIQFDYLGDTIIHADFARVDLNEKVEVKIHVKLTGEAAGLKHAGAVLLHPASELVVRCTVTEIPDELEVDISNLEVDHSIHVREITAPAGVEILTDPEAVVATIHMKKEEVVAEAAAAEGAAAEPEVIREKKPDADADAKAGDKKDAKAAPAKAGEKKDAKPAEKGKK